MKFTINRNEFTKALLNVCRIIQKGMQPILQNVKLSLDNDGLNIVGSCDDLSISQTIPLFIGEDEIIRDVRQGSILVNAKLICDVVRKLTGNEISFELLDGSVAKISNNKTVFKLNTTRAEEYSDIDFEASGAEITIDAKDFVTAVNEVGFAASTKDTRKILTAINLVASNNTLTLTATDGARLATKRLSIASQSIFNINIPSKSLLEAIKSITDEEQIKLFISDRKCLLILKDSLVASKLLIVGEYPNTKNIIPKNFFYHLEINSEELINAMDRISLLSVDRENVVKITMMQDKVEISSRSQQYGSGVEILNEFKYEGERLEISFNSEYVSSAIKALKCDDVVLSFTGEMKPFTVTNPKNDDIIQLITPMRTF